MRKAKKNLHRMPKLSFLDQMLYWIGLLLLGASYLLLVLSPMLLRDKIAFSDDAVIAVTETASAFWAVIPCLSFLLITLIPWTILYNDRRPIFGLKNFQYGPPAWPKVYPLFMKNKPYVWVSERKKKEKKRIAILLILILLVSFIPYPWSLYGRNCLYADGSIRQYSMFNNRKQEILPQEMESAEFSVYTYTSGKYTKTRHWGVQITLSTGSKRQHTFQSGDFRRAPQSGTPGWLTEMVRLTDCYDPEIICFSNQEELRKVAIDHELTAEAQHLLYQLFGQAE